MVMKSVKICFFFYFKIFNIQEKKRNKWRKKCYSTIQVRKILFFLSSDVYMVIYKTPYPSVSTSEHWNTNVRVETAILETCEKNIVFKVKSCCKVIVLVQVTLSNAALNAERVSDDKYVFRWLKDIVLIVITRMIH